MVIGTWITTALVSDLVQNLLEWVQGCVMGTASSRLQGVGIPLARCIQRSLFPRPSNVAGVFCFAQFNQGARQCVYSHTQRTLAQTALQGTTSEQHPIKHHQNSHKTEAQPGPFPPPWVSRLKLSREKKLLCPLLLREPWSWAFLTTINIANHLFTKARLALSRATARVS